MKNNMRIVRDLDVLRFKSGDQTWFAARTVTPIVGAPLAPHYSNPYQVLVGAPLAPHYSNPYQVLV